MRRKEWRCFHCDELFTNADKAREHFGYYGVVAYSEPACTIDAAKYREMELRMHRYNEEDSDLHRALHAMESKHQTDLRREEEKGYARGLEAATAALRTLDALKYTYRQGADLWMPPAGLRNAITTALFQCNIVSWTQAAELAERVMSISNAEATQ